MIKQGIVGLFLTMLWFTPNGAYAAGANFFLQGLSHPMMVPAQLIATFSLGLLIGQQGWSHLRIVLPVFLLALVVGLIATRYQTISWNSEMILLPLAALTGLLATLKRQLPIVITLLAAIIAAFVIGMDSAVPMIPGLQVRKIYASLAGSGLSIFGMLLLISLIAMLLRNVLQGVVLRVLGAWSTAGAALVLALLLTNISRS